MAFGILGLQVAQSPLNCAGLDWVPLLKQVDKYLMLYITVSLNVIIDNICTAD